MKIGFCIGTDAQKTKKLAQYGYDHYEVSFAGINQMDDGEFADFCREVEKAGISCRGCNVMFPKNVSLYRDFGVEEVQKYIVRGMERMAALGGKIAVLGSGVFRNIPEGYDRELAKKQFVEIVRICADEAQRRGISIAVEPLSRKETNFIHLLAEGAEICREANRENVGLTADFFHMYSNDDAFSNLETYSSIITHLHIARFAPDRGAPNATDVEDFRPIAERMHKLRYGGALSVECKTTLGFDEVLQNFRPVAELFRG